MVFVLIYKIFESYYLLVDEELFFNLTFLFVIEFLVSTLGSDASYDYVFGGPLEKSAVSSTIKLTSPPIRLRSDGT